MKYDKEVLKEKVISLYKEGKNFTEISKLTGVSRKYVTDLIKKDSSFTDFKNRKIVNVYKRKNINEKRISIPPEFWNKIGISDDINVGEQVEVLVDESEKTIIIKKYRTF